MYAFLLLFTFLNICRFALLFCVPVRARCRPHAIPAFILYLDSCISFQLLGTGPKPSGKGMGLIRSPPLSALNGECSGLLCFRLKFCWRVAHGCRSGRGNGTGWDRSERCQVGFVGERERVEGLFNGWRREMEGWDFDLITLWEQASLGQSLHGSQADRSLPY